MPRRDLDGEELEIRLNAAQQHISAMNARIKQMDDQHKSQSEHQMAEITRLRHMEDSARALCTLILSKDRNELVLGTDYTWNKIPTEELIHKTVTSFKEYCKQRTRDLKAIKDFAMEKTDALQDAQDKIQELQINQNDTAKKEAAVSVLRDKLESSEKGLTKAFRNMDIRQDEDEEEYTSTLLSKTAKSINEEITREEIHKGYAKEARTRSPESEERRQQRKRAAIDTVNSEVITMESILSDDERTVIRTMGKGLSLSTEIRKMCELNAARFREAVLSLDRKNIITSATGIYIPGEGGTPNIHILSPLGEKIYKIITNEYPETAEAIKIKNAHATFEHGYGIRALYKLLRESGRYEKVNMFMPEIDLGNGTRYRADIQAAFRKADDGTTPMPDYFEYERVRQTPEEYNAKFNKMAIITDGINVVVPSSNDHRQMHQYMYDWAQRNKDNPKCSAVVLRLTSLTVLKSKIGKTDFNEWWNVNAHITRFPAPAEK